VSVRQVSPEALCEADAIFGCRISRRGTGGCHRTEVRRRYTGAECGPDSSWPTDSSRGPPKDVVSSAGNSYHSADRAHLRCGASLRRSDILTHHDPRHAVPSARWCTSTATGTSRSDETPTPTNVEPEHQGKSSLSRSLLRAPCSSVSGVLGSSADDGRTPGRDRAPGAALWARRTMRINRAALRPLSDPLIEPFPGARACIDAGRQTVG